MSKTTFPYSKIKATYDAALSNFDDSYRIHFCIRLYRATGEKFYLQQIVEYIESTADTTIRKLQKIYDLRPEEIIITEPIRGTILRNKVEHSRIVRRQEYYKTHPQLKFYFDAISTLYFLFDFKIHNQDLYNDKIFSIISEYRSFNWEKEFVKLEHLLVHPVLFVNSMYQLYEMGMVTSVDAIHEMIHNHFPPKKILKDEKLFDQLYIYTHVIINESRFYQDFLDVKQSENFEWILDFFNVHFEEYHRDVNIDLLVEILTCFFLAHRKNPLEEKILFYLHKFYDPTLHYLKKDEESTLQDMEHAHAIFLIYGLKPKILY